MVENSRRARVGLGLIGLGPCWDQTYRDAIVRLKSRLTIRAIYDPVEARSKSVAAEWDASVASSIRQLVARPSLQGILVLDSGWCHSGLLSLILRSGKPAFLAKPVLHHPSRATTLFDDFASSPNADSQNSKWDDLLMPELSFRFTPASCRLRELMVTKLGPVQRIEIDCNWNCSPQVNVSLIDWCIDLMGKAPTAAPSISRLPGGGFDAGILFPGSTISPEGKVNEVRSVKVRHRPSQDSCARIEIQCQKGCAVLLDRTHLTWRSETTSGDELLTEERTEIEILIDQFCRRALGGLNPVGRLSEFLRADKIADGISLSVC